MVTVILKYRSKTGIKIVSVTLILTALIALLVLTAAWFFVTNPNPFQKSKVAGIGRSGKGAASKELLETHVRAQVDIAPPRSEANPESLDRAANYIRMHLQKAGLQTEDQIYQVGKAQYRTVRARIAGREKGLIVIGAHYDICGDTPGADDNGSAVAGLLELARLIGESGFPPRKSIELVAWTLEEPPHFREDTMGSYVHAQSLVKQGEVPALAISLEMLGFFSDEENSQSFHVWPLRLL